MNDLTLASRLLLADLATLSDGGRVAAHVACYNCEQRKEA